MPSLDSDLETMNRAALLTEIKKLRAGIRKHRDSSGHNLCWYVPELWNLLPENESVTPEIPPKEEFMECCKKYRDSLGELRRRGGFGRHAILRRLCSKGRAGSTPVDGTHMSTCWN